MFGKFGTQWMVARMSKRKVKLRKDLNADALFSRVRSGFERIPDHRSGDIEIPLADALMSAFAMFSLKDPSLLAFEERRSGDTNLKTVYKHKFPAVHLWAPQCSACYILTHQYLCQIHSGQKCKSNPEWDCR